MRCIIVDDEPLAVEGMLLNINQIDSLELVGSFSNALDAHKFLKDNEIDLMFLDINMPNLTGLELVKIISNPPMIIFTTAYSEYAVESYEVAAIDYLTKPIRFQRFFQAVNKAEEQYRLRKKTETSTSNQNLSEYILIKADRRTHRVYVNDIYYIEGLKDYVLVHTQAEKLAVAMNIKTIGKQLPESYFVRINKSFIVNLNHINSFDNDFLKIDSKELPIGLVFRENFLKKIAQDRVLKR
ncbi:LytTR family DNA-binding domain-containing protein [Runella sp. SP2]|uniref:LytR/AlgR family response regulator transcription factor n=1 Tax=Runella sp. SP2 TaxID=2268026 RepID=UPI000F07463D|nr:LytTR family DNA-binding domain-containing protein [Runella sp. SP2]AYQ33126.1 DNA-binding response regulator [Runella sp. SP2]